MNKNQRILIGIAFVLLFAGIALATSSTSSDVVIYDRRLVYHNINLIN